LAPVVATGETAGVVKGVVLTIGPRVPDAVRRPLRCSAEPGPN
jgi:hypothetical protein